MKTLLNSRDEASYKLYCSWYQENRGLYGVAIDIKSCLANHYMEWKDFGARICFLRVVLSQWRSPLFVSMPRMKKHKLQIKRTPRKDILPRGRDLNAKVAEPLDGEKKHIGRFGLGVLQIL